MKTAAFKIRSLLYISVIGLLLLFGLAPTQPSHAQTSTSPHDIQMMQSVTCSGPCTTTAIFKPEENLFLQEDDQDPEPPETTPAYILTSAYQEPIRPSGVYIFGAALLRPPDLVKLYSNFRF
jgi:hypothetical protein